MPHTQLRGTEKTLGKAKMNLQFISILSYKSMLKRQITCQIGVYQWTGTQPAKTTGPRNKAT